MQLRELHRAAFTRAIITVFPSAAESTREERRSEERFNLIGICTASASSAMIKEEELPFRWLINVHYESAIRGLLLASSM